ncbi:MAG: hypothetical protein R2911_36280 [Caldilineaceae bacterium]
MSRSATVFIDEVIANGYLAGRDGRCGHQIAGLGHHRCFKCTLCRSAPLYVFFGRDQVLIYDRAGTTQDRGRHAPGPEE